MFFKDKQWGPITTLWRIVFNTLIGLKLFVFKLCEAALKLTSELHRLTLPRWMMWVAISPTSVVCRIRSRSKLGIDPEF